LGIFVRKALEKQFKEQDIAELETLERKFSGIQAASGAADIDLEDIQVAARRANLVASRLGQYTDYAAFPAFLRAAWLQAYFASLNGFTPLQFREIIRQQQRACAGWANIAMAASLNIQTAKQSSGFLVKRHYDFAPTLDGSRQKLAAGSLILGIDGAETKDMSDETFAALLSGPLATKVSLLVKRPTGDIYTLVAERELGAQSLPEFEKRTLLERDIGVSIHELERRTKELENEASSTFTIAEHVRWTKYPDSYKFSSTRISAATVIDIENGTVEIGLQEKDIPGLCTAAAGSSKGCVADKKYRVSGGGDGDVSYLAVSEGSGVKTGCLHSSASTSQGRTSYSIDDVRKYADTKKTCLQTYYANAVMEHQNLIKKIGRMMEIKTGVVLMARHLDTLDSKMQSLVDRGYGNVPYVACGNIRSSQGAGTIRCIPERAL
jgi:hypothetical protein